MTRSIWRWSHLLLALVVSVFLILASISGFLLGIDPLQHTVEREYKKVNKELSIQETIDSLSHNCIEIFHIECDDYGFYNASVLNEKGDFETYQFHPQTGKKTGNVIVKSKFYDWMTTFHRSLFLDKIGRFFIGITATILLFIAISGIILVIQRSKSLKSLFDKVEKNEKTLSVRFYHIVFGRLAFVPITILSLTGSYLFLQRFGILNEVTNPVLIVENTENEHEKTFDFKTTALHKIKKIEFPFSPDDEDYFIISTHDQEIAVHQYNFSILAQVDYSSHAILSTWALDLHTAKGRVSAYWALILMLSCLSILYFIYSGVKIFVFSLKGRIKNKYSLTESEILILVGSQTANTLIFAKLVYKQFIEEEYKVFISDLNGYKPASNIRHVIVFTSTYGVGEPPINGTHFIEKWHKKPLPQNFYYSVVGFGSLSYPDFCLFAIQIDKLFEKFPQAQRQLPIVKIHNQSYHSLRNWAMEWNKNTRYSLKLPTSIETKQLPLKSFIVDEKTIVSRNQDNETFTLKLSAKGRYVFHSGDLLAVYPPTDSYQRLYSIGKLSNKQFIISVRKHEFGICSQYLEQLQNGETIDVAIKQNSSFYYRPSRTAVFIGNGTGMGVFLGMITENINKKQLYVYWGGRTKESYSLYEKELNSLKKQNKITELNIAFSRPVEQKQYVGDIVRKDGEKIAYLLKNKAIVYICGSLAMQQDVLRELDNIAHMFLNKTLNFYQKRGQIKMDCY